MIKKNDKNQIEKEYKFFLVYTEFSKEDSFNLVDKIQILLGINPRTVNQRFSNIFSLECYLPNYTNNINNK